MFENIQVKLKKGDQGDILIACVCSLCDKEIMQTFGQPLDQMIKRAFIHMEESHSDETEMYESTPS